MAVSDPRPDGPDRLDELLTGFVEGGYTPDGAEIEDDPGGHPGHGHNGGHAAHASVREFDHRGHHVEIQTHYEVTIDGQPWTRPMQVLQDGSVLSHDLPQYVLPSAVDLLRAVIDNSYEAPDEIRAVLETTPEEE